MTPITIFFCYAREDEHLRKELEKQLKVLKHQKLIDMWHDREINAGVEWEKEIDQHLNTAQIILLLISPDFMDSDYCYGIEMKKAMVRHKQGETCVMPILLRPVHWQSAPFGKLQVLPDEARYIVSPSWHSLDEAFFSVAQAIREKVISLHIQQAIWLGKRHILAEKDKEALAVYTEALRLAPNNAELNNCKGIALYYLERYHEALKVFDKLISLDKNDARAFNNRGITLFRLNRKIYALADFNQAINLNPARLEMYVHKLHVLLQIKRYSEALDTLEKVFSIDATLEAPPFIYVEWAKQLFAKPNLAFLEVDTTGLYDDDEIIRILLLDCNGSLLFDTLICGDKEIPHEVSRITGILDVHLDKAPTLVDAWEDIRQAFEGKYIVSFNLEFDIAMLEAAAERYDLGMLSISGECLMKRAMLYSRTYSYSKLSDLCAYIDRPLPAYPHRTALHRTKGQVAILEAILQGKRLEDPYDGPPEQDLYTPEDVGYL